MKGSGKPICGSLNWAIGGRLEPAEWEPGEEHAAEDAERAKPWDEERSRVSWELTKELWSGSAARREREQDMEVEMLAGASWWYESGFYSECNRKPLMEFKQRGCDLIYIGKKYHYGRPAGYGWRVPELKQGNSWDSPDMRRRWCGTWW